ncbi:hypothetical protein BGW80DRAFT_1255889 [Lactifluus volemus]|nr:hypothetical protein BGW80DRAFT_1255889 [Lactifluus volemus]
MSEDTTGGDVLVGAQTYSEKQLEEQGGGGGGDGCCDEMQWQKEQQEDRGAHTQQGGKVNNRVAEKEGVDAMAMCSARGWRQQEWMLWQGAVACMVEKGPEEQGDEEVVEIDAFMRCSGAHVKESAEVCMQQEDNNRSKEIERGGNRCFN